MIVARRTGRWAALALMVTVMLGAGAPMAPAAENTATAGALRISGIRLVAATVPGRPTAIFFAIENMGDQADQLKSVSTPVCGRAELHTHTHVDGVMQMRPVPAFDLPAGQVTALRPMGMHIMCFDPVLPMNVGNPFPVTLTFAAAGVVTTDGGRIISVSEMAAQADPATAPTPSDSGDFQQNTPPPTHPAF